MVLVLSKVKTYMYGTNKQVNDANCVEDSESKHERNLMDDRLLVTAELLLSSLGLYAVAQFLVELESGSQITRFIWLRRWKAGAQFKGVGGWIEWNRLRSDRLNSKLLGRSYKINSVKHSHSLRLGHFVVRAQH